MSAVLNGGECERTPDPVASKSDGGFTPAVPEDDGGSDPAVPEDGGGSDPSRAGRSGDPGGLRDERDLMWATRGRDWGHRFLSDGGFADPLPVYDAVLAGRVTDCPDVHVVPPGATGVFRDREGRLRGIAGAVAMRFLDPEGREDRSGRPIVHELIVFPPLSDGVRSLQEGMRLVWPTLGPRYASVWDADVT